MPTIISDGTGLLRPTRLPVHNYSSSPGTQGTRHAQTQERPSLRPMITVNQQPSPEWYFHLCSQEPQRFLRFVMLTSSR